MRNSILLILFAAALGGSQTSTAQTVWIVNADYVADPGEDLLNYDGDPSDGICDTGNATDGFTGRCTLEAALGQSSDGDIVRFDPSLTVIFPIALRETPTSGTNLGVWVKKKNITIDGLIGTSRQMIIDFSLLGRIYSGGADCFQIQGLGATFKNLEIRNCNRYALLFSSADSWEDGRDATIQSNYIHDNRGGIWFYDAGNSTIGGPTSAPGTGLGNIISASGTFGGIVFETNKAGGGPSVADCSGTTVEGNLIGADLDGPAGNGGLGILTGCNGVHIGGPDPTQRNIISNNGFGKHQFAQHSGSGIVVQWAENTVIQGNYIGTDPTGQLQWGNAEHGIEVLWTGEDDPNPGAGGKIGGVVPGAGNIISNNGKNGVVIWSSDRVTVENNIIGTGLVGTEMFGNAEHGIRIFGDESRIGSFDGEHPNILAFNGLDGVFVQSGTGNAISGNRIYGNAGIGVNLDEDGVFDTRDLATPNDALDADIGANNLQNSPRISTVDISSGEIELTYTVDSDPGNADFPLDIEFFALDDDSEEGETLVATDIFTVVDYSDCGTPPCGKSMMLVRRPGAPLTDRIVATARDASGNTSEFSRTGIIVNSIADNNDSSPGDGSCDTGNTIVRDGNGEPECTLRAAIEETNASPEANIAFNIPTAGKQGTIPVILPHTSLPTVTSAVVIDGTSQPGGRVAIDGTNAGLVDGITITSGGSTVAGLAILRFGGNGILLDTGDGNAIRDCFIGMNPEGPDVGGNAQNGIEIKASSNNIIGGTENGERNVIVGNSENGIRIGAVSSGNQVLGNLIGTDEGSTAGIGNRIGIFVSLTADNEIGGSAKGSGNVVSGNTKYGIHIRGFFGDDVANNHIKGNLIGTTVDGSAALPNTEHGVFIEGGADITIGDVSAGGRNVISGNNQNGIFVKGVDSNVSVIGNYIGTDSTGTLDIGNKWHGIAIAEAVRKNTIGGAQVGERNVISGNDSSGVAIISSDSVAVLGNYIGTKKTGEDKVGNKIGILVRSGRHARIGGEEEKQGNRISGNDSTGVAVIGETSTGISIQRNEIFKNGSLSIDLNGDDVTPNDLDDGVRLNMDKDAGPNELFNFPVGVTAGKDSLDANLVIITGILDTPSPELATIDVYSSTEANPKKNGKTRFGDTEKYIGSATPNANGLFRLDLAKADVPHPVISAIATSDKGSSSEVSWVCFDTDGNGDTDSDGDSLCDDWESTAGGSNGGIDYDGDGTVDLDLTSIDPGMSADPAKPDIFVEIDYMAPGGGHARGEKPQDGVLADVTTPFTNKGVNLHLLQDDSDVLPHADVIRFGIRGPGVLDDFNDYKLGNPLMPCGGASKAHFGTATDRAADNCASIMGARRLSFRYTIFAHSYNDGGGAGSSGKAELPGNDFLVSIGSWSWGGIPRRRMREAGTLMHEMGHTLNLRHGGGDNVQWKPNYPSVMNYMLQLGSSVPGRDLDYSRDSLATLLETALDETAGIGGTTARRVIYNKSSAGVAGSFGATGRANVTAAAVDWNGQNGATEASVIVDLNFHGTWTDTGGTAHNVGGPPGFESAGLKGHDDWSNLFFGFRSMGDFDDGTDRTDDPTTQPEMNFEFVEFVISTFDYDEDGFVNGIDNCGQIANPDQLDADGDGIGDVCEAGASDLGLLLQATPSPATVGFPITYTVEIRNNGPDEATNVMLVDSLDSKTDFVSASSTAGGCSSDGVVVECSIGSLAVNATATVTIEATLSESVATRNNSVASSSELDPDLANNTWELTVQSTGSTNNDVDESGAFRFGLHQNYPNPFRSTTTIRFDVEKPSDVRIEVFNILGQKVSTLIDRHYSPGQYAASLNGRSLPSGVYFYRIDMGTYSDVKRMLLVR